MLLLLCAKHILHNNLPVSAKSPCSPCCCRQTCAAKDVLPTADRIRRQLEKLFVRNGVPLRLNEIELATRKADMKTKSWRRLIIVPCGLLLVGAADAAGPGRPAWSGPVKPAWTKPLAPAWQPAPPPPPPPPPRQHVHRRPPRPPHPAPPPPPYTEVSIEAPQPAAQPIGVQPPQPPAPLTIHYDFR